MAKKTAKKRVTKPASKGVGDCVTLTAETEKSGPSFDPAAVVALGCTMYNVRESVQATAIKRAAGCNPVPLSAVKVAILEHNLGWALETDDKEECSSGSSPESSAS